VDEDSEATFDNWQQGRYENFSRHCTTVRAVRWIGMEIKEYPTYDGTSDLHSFLIDMEGKVVAEQRISTLDLALKSSPTRWWDTHKETLSSWDEVKLSIQHHFLPLMQVQQLGQDWKKKSQMLSLEIYDGQSNPVAHIEHCLKVWKVAQLPSYLWTHQFFHSLGTIPKAWYVHEETRRQTTCWKTLQNQFFHDFSFSGKTPEITVVLQQIKKMLFSNEFKPKHPLTVFSEHEHFLEYSLYPSPVRIPMACSKVDKDPGDPEELEELRHLTFQESTGTREVKDTISGDINNSYTQPLKLQKVNIRE
jgi:hypothetical protein